jgi:hypothetical protein
VKGCVGTSHGLELTVFEQSTTVHKYNLFRVDLDNFQVADGSFVSESNLIKESRVLPGVEGGACQSLPQLVCNLASIKVQSGSNSWFEDQSSGERPEAGKFNWPVKGPVSVGVIDHGAGVSGLRSSVRDAELFLDSVNEHYEMTQHMGLTRPFDVKRRRAEEADGLPGFKEEVLDGVCNRKAFPFSRPGVDVMVGSGTAYSMKKNRKGQRCWRLKMHGATGFLYKTSWHCVDGQEIMYRLSMLGPEDPMPPMIVLALRVWRSDVVAHGYGLTKLVTPDALFTDYGSWDFTGSFQVRGWLYGLGIDCVPEKAFDYPPIEVAAVILPRKMKRRFYAETRDGFIELPYNHKRRWDLITRKGYLKHLRRLGVLFDTHYVDGSSFETVRIVRMVDIPVLQSDPSEFGDLDAFEQQFKGTRKPKLRKPKRMDSREVNNLITVLMRKNLHWKVLEWLDDLKSPIILGLTRGEQRRVEQLKDFDNEILFRTTFGIRCRKVVVQSGWRGCMRADCVSSSSEREAPTTTSDEEEERASSIVTVPEPPSERLPRTRSKFTRMYRLRRAIGALMRAPGTIEKAERMMSGFDSVLGENGVLSKFMDLAVDLVVFFRADPLSKSLLAMKLIKYFVAKQDGLARAIFLEWLERAKMQQEDVPIRGETIGDVILQAGEIPRFRETEVARAMSQVTGMLVTSHLFSTFPESLRSVIEYWIDSVSTLWRDMDLVSAVVGTANMLVKRLDKFSQTGKWADLLGGDAVSECLAKGDEIQELLEKAKDSRERIPKPLIEEKFLEFKKKTQRVLTGSSVPILSAKLVSVTEDFEVFMRSTEGYRAEPYGICFHGDPGTGKTTMTGHLEHIVAHRCGIDVKDGLTYTLTNTKHQTLGGRMLILVLNDYFSSKAAPGEQGPISVLQSLIDKAPVALETASIAEKRASHIKAMMVVINTNGKHYYDSTACTGSRKLDRRILQVEMTWNEKAKRLANSRGYAVEETFKFCQQHDLVTYRVGRTLNEESGSTYNLAIKNLLFETDDLGSLLVFLQKDFNAQQDRAEVVRDEEPESCPCGLPKNVKHDCGVVVITDEFCPHCGLYKMEDHVCVEESTLHVQAGKRSRDSKDDLLSPPTIRRLRIAIVGMTALATFSVLAIMWMKSKPLVQATVRTTPSFPTEKTDVRSYRGGGEFLPASLKEFRTKAVVTVTKVGGRSSRAIFLNSTLLVMPRHVVVTDWKPIVYPVELIVEVSGSQILLGLSHKEVYDSGTDALYIRWNGMNRLPVDFISELTTPQPGECSFKGETSVASLVQHEGRVYYTLPVKVETEDGDCGIPLFVAGRLAGMHHALIVGTGKVLSVPITAGDVQLARKHFESFSLTVFDVDYSFPKPMVVAQSAEVCAQGMHPKSDLAFVERLSPGSLEHVNLFPFCHEKVRAVPKMTGGPTDLHSVYGEMAGPYEKPNAGKAKEEHGWRSASTYLASSLPVVATSPPLEVIDRAIRVIASRIARPDRPLEPLSDFEAFCGTMENGFIRGRDTTKAVGLTMRAAGFPKQKFYQKRGEGDYEVPQVFLDELWTIETCIEAGLVPTMVTGATIKNEMLEVRKTSVGKARFFYVSDVAVNHLLRKYLLPILAYLLENQFESRCMGSVNRASRDWGRMASIMGRFGPTNFVDADFANFDLCHTWVLLHLRRFFCLLARLWGYPPRVVKVVEALLAMCDQTLLNVQGDWFISFLKLLSGLAVTFIFNCIANYIVFLCWLFMQFPTEQSIEDQAEPFFVGDDVTAGLSDLIKMFVDTWRLWAGRWGYTITPGDKIGTELRCVGLDGIRLCKAAFQWRDGYCWGVLAEKSIYKSLAYWIPGKIPQQERNQATINSACREFFLYGRKRFNEFVATVPAPYTCLTFDEIKVEFLSGSLETWSIDGTMESPYEGRRLELFTTTPCSKDVAAELETNAIVEQQASRLGGTPAAGIICSTEINSSKIFGAFSKINAPVTDLGAVSLSKNELLAAVRQPGQPYDRPVSLQEFMARPREIVELDSNTTYGPFGLSERFFNIPSVIEKTTGYGLFRGGPEVTIYCQGQPVAIGQSIVWFTPVPSLGPYEMGNPVLTGAVDPALLPSLFPTISQYPHFIIDFSHECTHTIKLPYCQPTMYRGFDDLDWTITIAPLTTPSCASAATPPVLKIQVWVSYPDLEMTRVVPQSGEPNGVQLSSALALAAEIAQAAPTPYAAPVSEVLRLGSSVASRAGYCKSTSAMTGMEGIAVDGRLATMSGEQYVGPTLRYNPLQAHNVSKSQIPLATDDDTTIRSVGSRWGLLLRNHLIVASTTGFVVDPMATLTGVGGALGVRPLTPVGFVASMFRYWAGSLQYKLSVVSSPLVRGRIGVVIIPAGSAPLAAFPLNGSARTFIFETCGSSDYEFEVPYEYVESYQVNALIDPFSAIVSTRYLIQVFPIGTILGIDAPVDLRCNLWVRAGSDFRVGIPDLQSIQGMTIVQSGVSKVVFAEAIDDLIELTRRSAYLGRLVTNEALPNVGLPVDGFAPRLALGNAGSIVLAFPCWTFATWLRMAYLGYTGGVRWSFLPFNTDLSQTSVLHTAVTFNTYQRAEITASEATYSPRRMSSGGAVLSTSVNSTWQIEVPDRNPLAFKRGKNPCITTSAVTTEVLVIGPRTIAALTAYDMWLAGADDFMVGGFLAAPMIISIT